MCGVGVGVGNDDGDTVLGESSLGILLGLSLNLSLGILLGINVGSWLEYNTLLGCSVGEVCVYTLGGILGDCGSNTLGSVTSRMEEEVYVFVFVFVFALYCSDRCSPLLLDCRRIDLYAS